MADACPNIGSPVLHHDGSSTNPNTPRSPTPDKPETVKDGTEQGNASFESTSSGDNSGDIQLTWPKSIDVTKVKAVASWDEHHLPNLFLDLHWHPKSHKAFIKLRGSVALLNGVGRRDGRTSIYLYIYPERIRQLSVDPNPTDKTLGAETLLLRFELNRPLALVLPKSTCEPRNKTANDVIDAFRGLAGQTCFSVHASLPRKKLSLKRIRELCMAATDAGLASLAVHASTASLYQGKGGEVVEGNTLAGLGDNPPTVDEPPPEYVEPPPVEPSSAALGDAKGSAKGTKRRRVNSTSPEPTESTSLQAIQALLDSRLCSLKQAFDDQLAAHKKNVAEMLDKTEARLLHTLQSDVEQRCDGIQEFLQHKVREEMAEVEENVMRSLSEAPLSATLTFPQHPWY